MPLLYFILLVEAFSAPAPKGKANLNASRMSLASTVHYLPFNTFSKPMAVAALAADDPCPGNFLMCAAGHIRLCSPGILQSEAPIAHSCRQQGCSTCPQSPDVCNDESGQDVCLSVPRDIWVATCTTPRPPVDFCDGSNVRICVAGSRSYVAEYCAGRGCSNSAPPRCSLSSTLAPSLGTPRPTPRTPTAFPTFQMAPTPFPTPGTTPPANCRVRQEWSTLSDQWRATFVRALLTLYQRGDTQRLADKHHLNNDTIHGTITRERMYSFLIWHRVFIFEFEQLLRGVIGDPCFALPYWNYGFSDTAAGRADRRSVFGTSSSKLGSGEQCGSSSCCIGGAFTGVRQNFDPPSCIHRNPSPSLIGYVRCSLLVDFADIGSLDYDTFARNLQNRLHPWPHNAMGSTFASHYSPVDPLFFLHHANVDRVWDMWQDCHQNYGWPVGLPTAVIAYPGVVVSNFLDNYNILWQGQRYSVSYSSDQWDDTTLYSPNFRRNVRTQCVGGGFRRYNNPRAIAGVDDWASVVTPQGQPAINFLRVESNDEPLQCINRTGTGNPATIGSVAAVYDTSFQGCVALCSTFFYKDGPQRNCLCVVRATKAPVPIQSFAPRARVSVASVTRYVPDCAGDATKYAYYFVPPPPLFPAWAPPPDNEACFDARSQNSSIAEIACSSNATRPPLIPLEFARMNNLNLTDRDVCKGFRPSTARTNFTCINLE